MSEAYIPIAVRRLVRERAGGMCEYCLSGEDERGFPLEVDHIRAIKHRGPTAPENLALCCPACNRAKGSDRGSHDPTSDEYVLFFDPRRDNWWDHFALVGAGIEGLTAVGRATALILMFNEPDRVEERELLMAVGSYPSEEALRRMRPAT